MKISGTPINGVFVAELSVHEDSRGLFSRWYCDSELERILNGERVVQANHSITRSVGAIRGLHYQKTPYLETKFIRCIRGRVFDVIVDLRRNSKTLLTWHSVELYEGDEKLLVIPKGCAHGFQVMEGNTELLYLHTAQYKPEYEGGIRHDDPALGINWPLKPCDLSDRDQSHPLLDKNFLGLDAN